MSLWTAQTAATATGGRATQNWQAQGVSIDTRSLQRGDLFVALSAARDGHDFVAEALAKGASAALVSRIPEGLDETAPLLIVDDVLAGLVALAQAARARTRARVLAVTGSVGKTSTKEMLRAILTRQGATHVAEASYNNHWGVPLTLARLPEDSRFAVIEIGMSHPGEIAPLARLAAPHVALITTIAPAHLEAFASLDAIAQEKAAIFEGLVPGGVAVINGDLAQSVLLQEAAAQARAEIVTFGASERADWHLQDLRLGAEVSVVRARQGAQALLYKISSPGRHFALNALGALAAAKALGADPVLAAQDLALWAPPAGRGQRERILLDSLEETSFELIDDAFNANPASMAAALDVLIAALPVDGVGRVGGGRRIAVLGDMLELGPQELDLHRAIAHHPGLSAIAVIHCVGPRMKALYDALPPAQRGEWVGEADQLAARARALADAGDILLVKGSKSAKVSRVVDALRKLGQSASKF